jgi:hypothetical protein
MKLISDRLTPKERAKFDHQRLCCCDHGTVCEGMRGKIEDAIVACMVELQTEYPLTYRSHSTCRPHAVLLAIDIMDIVNEKWTGEKQRKGEKT